MNTSFTMSPIKQGRIKYLLMTIAPALAVMYLFSWLVSSGLMPGGETFGMVYTGISMGFMLVMGYFLIFMKNHTVEIKNRTIHHRDWRGKTSEIPLALIHGYRRNLLKEYILFDRAGNRLLCVESNMVNFDLFEQWIQNHNINRLD